MVGRQLIVAGFIALCFSGVAPAQTLPAQSRPAADSIADDIKQLGADDYAARQAATERLWKAGPAAEPALTEALKSSDGEVRSRAQEILEKFKYGILPDTPQEVVDIARQYRGAAKEQKRALVYQLVQMGHKADEVLRRIAASEDSTDIRDMIQDAMASNAGSRAAEAIAAGNPADAEKILLGAMRFSYDSVRRDYAAYALFTHKLDAVISDLEADPHTLRYGGEMQTNLRLLAYCYRAKGDLATALSTARRLNDDTLVAQLQFEACDWKALAERLKPENLPTGAPNEQVMANELSRMVMQKLAGDATGMEASLAKLKELGPPSSILARALFVSGHVPDAIELFKSHPEDDATSFFDMLVERGDDAGALAAADTAVKADAKNTQLIQFWIIKAQYELGEDKKAADLFHKIRTDVEPGADFTLIARLIDTARQIGLKDEAFQIATVHFKDVEQRNGDPAAPPPNAGSIDTFMAALYPDDSDRQLYWYKLLRKAGRTSDDALKTIRTLEEKTISEKDLGALVEKATAMIGEPEDGQDPSDEDKAQRVAFIAGTLYDLGNPAASQPLLAKLADSSKASEPLIALGDIAVDKKDWPSAAKYYQQAFDRDTTSPALLYLSGAALLRAGKADEGNAAQGKADLMMLGEENLRSLAADMLTQRGMADQAAKQYELILRTGDFQSPVMNEAVTALQSRYSDAGNYAGALSMAERSVAAALSVQLAGGGSPELLLPALTPLLQSRAQQAIAQGHVDVAQDALAQAAAISPVDMSAELAVVPQLEKAGQKELADKTFNRVWDLMQQQLKDHPNNPTVLNNAAWFAAKIGRHLDDALAYSTKATTLRPDQIEFIDTLAESQFVNGHAKEAVDTEKKALQLTPEFGFLREQITRFQNPQK